MRIFRQALRLTAYHEAAHVAARMFTGLEANHLVSVSIIPDSECEGHAKSERNAAIGMLQSYPPPKIRTAGRCLLLTLLAGRGAEARLDPRKKKAALDLQSRLLQSQILVPLIHVFGRPSSRLWRPKYSALSGRNIRPPFDACQQCRHHGGRPG